jgi:E3 ubiquitin-protein ligase TRIP12
MKSNQERDKEAQQIGEEDNQITDFDEPGFSDIDLKTGFSEIQPSCFHHQKLDSYLQKSIKDPYNLVQGAISTNLQQIFSNCPFLFPFSTK